VGLAKGVIGADLFGVAIMMTLVTTVIAPIALVPLFRGAPGRRGVEPTAEPIEVERPIAIEMPPSISRNLVDLLVTCFREAGYRLTFEDSESGLYQLTKGEDQVVSVVRREGRVVIEAPPAVHEEVQQVVNRAEERLIWAVRQIHEVPPPSPDAPREGNPTATIDVPS